MSDSDLDELPRRNWRPLLIVLGLGIAGAVGWKLLHPPPPPEPPERVLFRKLLPNWVIAQSRGQLTAPEALAACITAAKPWPEVARALEGLPAAWFDPERLKAAVKALNRAARVSGLPFWVDPQFPGNKPVLTTYEVLRRTAWRSGEATTEALQVRRLDTLNLELQLLGHASGDQPAVLRDRVELAVLDRLRVDAGDRPNEVDTLAVQLWRERLAPLVDAAGLDEAERRINERERRALEMEKRLRGGRIHVARPARLVFGPEYFEALEPYTSTRRLGGPLILASDLRALQRADEALGDSEGLKALMQVIELEADAVEAHEVRHAFDPEELPVPPLVQRLVGEDDLRFGLMASRELRAFLGQLHDAKLPACVSVAHFARLARGRHAQSTPHFFAAHALLATLGGVDGERGLDREAVLEVTRALCALPDAELRHRGEAAWQALYDEPMPPAVRE